MNFGKELFDIKVNLLIAQEELRQKKQEVEELQNQYKKVEEMKAKQEVSKRQESNDYSDLSSFQSIPLYDSFSSVILSENQSSLMDSLDETGFNETLTNASVTTTHTHEESDDRIAEVSGDGLRLFVRFLSKRIEQQSLYHYFAQFGPIADFYYPWNPDKFYAYVTFSKFYDKSPLSRKYHTIDGTDIELDIAREIQEVEKSLCLLVAASPGRLSEKSLKDFFSKYGKIIKITRKQDRNGNYTRHSAISFDSYESVDKAVGDRIHAIDGVPVDVRRSAKSYSTP